MEFYLVLMQQIKSSLELFMSQQYYLSLSLIHKHSLHFIHLFSPFQVSFFLSISWLKFAFPIYYYNLHSIEVMQVAQLLLPMKMLKLY